MILLEKTVSKFTNLYRINSYKSSLSVLTAPSKGLFYRLYYQTEIKILFKKTNNKDLSSYIFQSKEILKHQF